MEDVYFFDSKLKWSQMWIQSLQMLVSIKEDTTVYRRKKKSSGNQVGTKFAPGIAAAQFRRHIFLLQLEILVLSAVLLTV